MNANHYSRLSWFLLFMLGVIILSTNSCVEAEHGYSKLAPGIYRASLFLEGRPLIGDRDEITTDKMIIDGELPFNMEVFYIDDDNFYVEIINGEERIRIDEIQYGWDKSTARDTLVMNFPVFDTYIKAIYHENVMEGEWIVNYKENYSIPFVAYHGQAHRFEERQQDPITNISGKWQCTFEPDTEDEYPAIGIFEQDVKRLTGTYKTETGDYRYLEGSIEGNKFGMSCFDGSHAFLFEGKIINDDILGTFRSGNHYKSIWEAKRNDGFALGNAYELTQSLTNEAIDFSFPNTNNEEIALSDKRYDNKVKLVTIMGTWCPNCMDETRFLKEYLKKNPSDKYEVITIAFERYKDNAKSMNALSKYKKKYDIDYEVLLGGYYNKKQAAEKLPFIDKVLSYPTLLFIDKNNKIRKIHTGFAGPATDEYDAFQQEFDETLNSLINEI